MSIKVDVSELKTFKACKRQWQLSSRNRFHLRPIVTPAQFALGTIFHEALADLYLGANLDKVMQFVRREMTTDKDAALLAMIPGYYKEVLPGDLERFKVLDIEHHFEISPTTRDVSMLFPKEPKVDPKTGEAICDHMGRPLYQSSLVVVGSIDMIVLDVEQNKIYGFEHKTCKNFRDPSYLWMDEQPRVYTWALQKYVEEYNTKHPENPATLGGIYLNEVKKLLRQFQYRRTLCTYPEDDMDNFLQAFFDDCTACMHAIHNNSYAAPKPSYFSCSMCAFNTICSTYMYSNLDKDTVLEEFKEEFVQRDEDHLEEKAERSTE